MDAATFARFERSFVPEPNTGCWLWLAHLEKGYGRMSVAGKRQFAHRLSYEHVNGLIPNGLQVDHLCRVPCCVNPDHLEAVTPKVNTLRGLAIPAFNSKKTHCKRGHVFDETNTYLVPKGRHCRECIHNRYVQWYTRRGYPNARKTHCPMGHEYDEQNTRITARGHRICRTCHATAERKRQRKGKK